MPHPILVVVLLLLVIVALLLISLHRWRRGIPFTLAQALFWWMAKILTRVLWRAKVPPELPLPPGRGAIVVCNHRSSVDPFFIQTATRRKIHWMVAREYCEHPAFRWFLTRCEVIPVRRGGIDTAATRAAIRLTREGGVVGMLPEGRINTTDQFMLSVRPGAILVALKAGVPIVPCYIQGAPYKGTAYSPLLMRARVEVSFGEPIDLSEYQGQEDHQELVHELLRRVVRAIAELAGEHAFEPEIAGRRWRPED